MPLFKRFCDAFLSLFLLALLSPFLFFVSLIVFLRLGSPIFFSQMRPGLHGRPFLLLKFRTMTNDFDSNGAFLADAQRLMPLGRLLRTTSIDVLPSLINILRGEMSFVGPRPFVIELHEYDEQYLSRFSVLPGLTGWSQVHGRNALSWEQKFELDCWYVKNKSFLLDFLIILRTLFVLFDYRSVNAPGFATRSHRPYMPT